MKYILFYIAFGLLPTTLLAQQEFLGTKTKIYLVRHGEKETGKDPVLTAAGMQRAAALWQKLKGKEVIRIYATPYRRTQMTGDSLRLHLAVDTVIYAADTMGIDLVNKINAHHDIGKTILVIGHSNTIPYLIRRLGVTGYKPKELPESEFDNLFLITYKRKKAKLKQMKYGERSAAPAIMK